MISRFWLVDRLKGWHLSLSSLVPCPRMLLHGQIFKQLFLSQGQGFLSCPFRTSEWKSSGGSFETLEIHQRINVPLTIGHKTLPTRFRSQILTRPSETAPNKHPSSFMKFAAKIASQKRQFKQKIFFLFHQLADEVQGYLWIWQFWFICWLLICGTHSAFHSKNMIFNFIQSFQ